MPIGARLTRKHINFAIFRCLLLLIAKLEEMTRMSYRNGWRLLKATPVADTRSDQMTGDSAEQLKSRGSAANTNCALRTSRRTVHKAKEWKMIDHAPKIKMMKEHGPYLRLDEEAERKLLGEFPAAL